jgi:hypothetical protein
MYEQHILKFGHSCGQIDDTIDVLQIAKESKYMNILEKIYVYETTKYGHLCRHTKPNFRYPYQNPANSSWQHHTLISHTIYTLPHHTVVQIRLSKQHLSARIHILAIIN